VDPVEQRGTAPAAMYSIGADILGVGNGFPGYTVSDAPPDTNMAVGDTQILQWGTGPLFDVDNMLRVFEYNSNLWQTTIEKDLPDLRDFIKGAWENRASDKSYMKILRGKAKT
jgi:hypothetical protein